MFRLFRGFTSYTRETRKEKKKNRVCMCLEVLLLCVHLVLGGLDSRVEAEFNGLLILNTMNVTQTSLYILDHITNTSFSRDHPSGWHGTLNS